MSRKLWYSITLVKFSIQTALLNYSNTGQEPESSLTTLLVTMIDQCPLNIQSIYVLFVHTRC